MCSRSWALTPMCCRAGLPRRVPRGRSFEGVPTARPGRGVGLGAAQACRMPVAAPTLALRWKPSATSPTGPMGAGAVSNSRAAGCTAVAFQNARLGLGGPFPAQGRPARPGASQPPAMALLGRRQDTRSWLCLGIEPQQHLGADLGMGNLMPQRRPARKARQPGGRARESAGRSRPGARPWQLPKAATAGCCRPQSPRPPSAWPASPGQRRQQCRASRCHEAPSAPD